MKALIKNTSRVIIISIICFLNGCTNSDLKSNNQATLNNDIKMVSERNVWYVNDELSNEENGILETRKRKMQYYFQGDTLINSVQYKKMYCKKLDSIFHRSIGSVNDSQFNSTFNDTEYIAAMREDGGSVFFVYNGQTAEDLYADFNINVGDVLNYKWNYTNETVIEIDYIDIGSNSIAKYKLSNGHYFYQVIGASYGLFNTWQANANVGGFLTCFRLDNTKIGIDEGFHSPVNSCPDF